MLTEEQKSFYSENGYILLDNIFTPEEIDECSEVYDALFEAKKANNNLESIWNGNWKENENIAIKGEDNLSVLSIHNLQCHSSVFTKMLMNENLVDAVADVIGSPNVLLHHTKAHVKPPGRGAPFPSHQDYHFFPFKDDSMVAIFIHLDDSDPENGGLGVFPGSHKLGPLKTVADINTRHWVDQDRFGLKDATPVRARRGQVLIFSYLLVHCSYTNTSDRVRRMLLFQMRSAEDEALKQIHLSPCHGMVLRGKNAKRGANFNARHENED